MIRQQFGYTPAMLCAPGGHRGRRGARSAETRMRGTKIIHCPDQIPPMLHRHRAACQSPASTRQRCQARTQGRVAPLAVGGVDAPVPVRATPQRLDPCGGALHDAPLDSNDPPRRLALDALRAADVTPGPPPRPSLGSRPLRLTAGLPHRSEVGDAPIGTAPKGAGGRTAPPPLEELPDQGHVALDTALAREPPTGLDHYRPRHPDDAPLGLDADRIGLDVPAVPGLLAPMLLHSLPLAAGTGLPRGNRPLVTSQGHDERWQWAAVRQQRQDEREGLGWRPLAVKRRSFRRGEGLVALRADEALVLTRMEANSALASLSSSGTRSIGAECRSGVHACPPSSVGERTKRSMAGPPFALQGHRTTVQRGATHLDVPGQKRPCNKRSFLHSNKQ
jgi:hypothetical protein